MMPTICLSLSHIGEYRLGDLIFTIGLATFLLLP